MEVAVAATRRLAHVLYVYSRSLSLLRLRTRPLLIPLVPLRTLTLTLIYPNLFTFSPN